MEIAETWAEKLRTNLPSLLAEHEALAAVAERATILLHGSTCRGVDDDFSDLDLFVVVTDADLAGVDRLSPTRFFEFVLDGKKGHFNALALEELASGLDECDLPLIAELRTADPIQDRLDRVQSLLERAQRPMSADVQRAFCCYHNYWMRASHRAADNPMERGDGVAVLLAVAQTVAHALRMALVLDGVAYPYEKWLHWESMRHPTGQRIAPTIAQILAAAQDGALVRAGAERDNPISQSLRQIRAVLVDTARRQGIDEPWLVQWWLYIDQSQRAIQDVRWP
ncbi:MAG: DUF4037 domain-containing protein [Caldilineaceae bacterium]